MLNRRNNNGLVSYNPFREMDNFERDFFADLFKGFFSDMSLAEFKTDITDEGDSYKLEADLPGFSKDDIHIDINGDCLTIRAERHSEVEKKDKKHKYIRSERSYGSYSRSFDLSDVNSDDIKCKYDNGVLTLTLPKKEPQSPSSRRLEIE